MGDGSVVVVEIECHVANSFSLSYKEQKYLDYTRRVEQALSNRLGELGFQLEVLKNPGLGKGVAAERALWDHRDWYTKVAGVSAKALRYPRHGSFEVTVLCPQELSLAGVPSRFQVWSKLCSHRWPHPKQLADSVARVLFEGRDRRRGSGEVVAALLRRIEAECCAAPLGSPSTVQFGAASPASPAPMASQSAPSSQPPMSFGLRPKRGAPTWVLPPNPSPPVTGQPWVSGGGLDRTLSAPALMDMASPQAEALPLPAMVTQASSPGRGASGSRPASASVGAAKRSLAMSPDATKFQVVARHDADALKRPASAGATRSKRLSRRSASASAEGASSQRRPASAGVSGRSVVSTPPFAVQPLLLSANDDPGSLLGMSPSTNPFMLIRCDFSKGTAEGIESMQRPKRNSISRRFAEALYFSGSCHIDASGAGLALGAPNAAATQAPGLADLALEKDGYDSDFEELVSDSQDAVSTPSLDITDLRAVRSKGEVEALRRELRKHAQEMEAAQAATRREQTEQIEDLKARLKRSEEAQVVALPQADRDAHRTATSQLDGKLEPKKLAVAREADMQGEAETIKTEVLLAPVEGSQVDEVDAHRMDELQEAMVKESSTRDDQEVAECSVEETMLPDEVVEVTSVGMMPGSPGAVAGSKKQVRIAPTQVELDGGRSPAVGDLQAVTEIQEDTPTPVELKVDSSPTTTTAVSSPAVARLHTSPAAEEVSAALTAVPGHEDSSQTSPGPGHQDPLQESPEPCRRGRWRSSRRQGAPHAEEATSLELELSSDATALPRGASREDAGAPPAPSRASWVALAADGYTEADLAPDVLSLSPVRRVHRGEIEDALEADWSSQGWSPQKEFSDGSQLDRTQMQTATSNDEHSCRAGSTETEETRLKSCRTVEATMDIDSEEENIAARWRSGQDSPSPDAKLAKQRARLALETSLDEGSSEQHSSHYAHASETMRTKQQARAVLQATLLYESESDASDEGDASCGDKVETVTKKDVARSALETTLLADSDSDLSDEVGACRPEPMRGLALPKAFPVDAQAQGAESIEGFVASAKPCVSPPNASGEDGYAEASNLEAQCDDALVVRAYSGFTEHVCRLAFDYENKYKKAPQVQTILPDGEVESCMRLAPMKGKDLVTHAYPQDIEASAAQQHLGLPFVWQRANGTYALVQAWSTSFNDKFRNAFKMSSVNPNPARFSPQAAAEFKKVVVELFGVEAEEHPILFAEQTSENNHAVYVGKGADLLRFFREFPEVMDEKRIIELMPDAFVCMCLDGTGRSRTKVVGLEADESYAFFTRPGPSGSVAEAFAEPLGRFHRWAELHIEAEELGVAARRQRQRRRDVEGGETKQEEQDRSLRAPSVHCLSTAILDDMRAAGLDAEHSTVRETNEALFCQRGKDMRCPRDSGVGAAYVDCLSGDGYVGRATHMLCYTWGCKVHAIVDALVDYSTSRGLDTRCTYVWACCICINQHRTHNLASSPPEYFQEDVRQRMRGTGHVLAVLAPWRAPSCLKRIWTSFEVTAAISEKGVQLDFLMLPAEAEDLRLAIADKGAEALKPLLRALRDWRVQDTHASTEGDRASLLSLMEQGLGLRSVSRSLAARLRHWFLVHVRGLAYEEGQSAESFRSSASFFTSLGDLLGRLGEPSDAADAYGWACEAWERAGEGCSLFTASAWGHVGAAFEAAGDAANALNAYEKALALYCGLGLSGAAAAAAVSSRAAVCGGVGKAALPLHAENKRLLELGVELESLEGARALREYGDALTEEGRYEEARLELGEAERIHNRLGKLGTPDHARLLASLGALSACLGDPVGALARLAEAVGVHRAAGTLDTDAGLRLLLRLGEAKLLRGDLPGALGALGAARAAHAERGSLAQEGEGMRVLYLIAKVESELSRSNAGGARSLLEEGEQEQKEKEEQVQDKKEDEEAEAEAEAEGQEETFASVEAEVPTAAAPVDVAAEAVPVGTMAESPKAAAAMMAIMAVKASPVGAREAEEASVTTDATDAA